MDIRWMGVSGRVYSMELCEFGRPFTTSSGVYLFCKPTIKGGDRWDSIYVGETENFDDRLNINLESHHRWAAIKVQGATNVCCLLVPGARSIRLAYETDLRAALNPPCNRQ